jgi:hypothetical protein
VVTLLVVGVVMAGVLVFGGPWMQRLAQPESFCPDSFGSEKVAGSSDLGERTAAYAGPGPHSVASYEAYIDFRTGKLELSGSKPSLEELPKTWDPRYEDDEPVDVQLLLCVYNQRDRTSAAQTLGQCDGYGVVAGSVEGLVDVRAAKVTYLLYEAATKRLLTKFDLAATEYVESDCPDHVFYRTDENPVIWLDPKPAVVAARLKPFVEASR